MDPHSKQCSTSKNSDVDASPKASFRREPAISKFVWPSATQCHPRLSTCPGSVPSSVLLHLQPAHGRSYGFSGLRPRYYCALFRLGFLRLRSLQLNSHHNVTPPVHSTKARSSPINGLNLLQAHTVSRFYFTPPAFHLLTVLKSSLSVTREYLGCICPPRFRRISCPAVLRIR